MPLFPILCKGGQSFGHRTESPRHAKNFLKWRIYPITDKLEIPRKLVTFQVMRRTLETDLQEHGTMKNAQTALRHASINTTANVYMQPIPASLVAALNSRTRAVLAKKRQASGKTSEAMIPNSKK
jgi:integrase